MLFTFCLMLLIKVSIESRDSRIIGGRYAAPKEIPSIVALLTTRNVQFCGGTLISTRFVLSAAHCIIKKPSKIVVLGGDLLIKEPYLKSRQLLKVQAITKHPLYNKQRTRYDFSVLELAKEAIESEYFSPIKLSTTRPEGHVECIVAGWGFVDPNGFGGSDRLKVAKIQTASEKECKASKISRQVDFSIMFCAGNVSGGTDSCYGDSGGPLICNNVLAGVVSFGEGCADEGYYGVYADVAAARDWIMSIVARGSSSRRLNKGKSFQKNIHSSSSSIVNQIWFTVFFVALLTCLQ